MWSAAATARCVLPEYVAKDAEEAAKYLHAREYIIVDGVVHELPRGDSSLFQRIKVLRYLKGIGPQAVDLWPGPEKPKKHMILNADAWGRIDAADGARVVAALKKTPYGWTIDECAYQALAVPGVDDALRNARWMTRAKSKTGTNK